MSARSDLGGLIAANAPDTWDVIPYPTRLATFEDPAKTVAVVIEQRGVSSGNTSPDDNGIPVAVTLAVWVVVDGARGDGADAIEDDLEAAAEAMIRILEPLPEHVWDGEATRDAYDQQKPAYLFTIRAAGALTPEE
jgi:hypothetical protein